jgi:hypothetical protein
VLKYLVATINLSRTRDWRECSMCVSWIHHELNNWMDCIKNYHAVVVANLQVMAGVKRRTCRTAFKHRMVSATDDGSSLIETWPTAYRAKATLLKLQSMAAASLLTRNRRRWWILYWRNRWRWWILYWRARRTEISEFVRGCAHRLKWQRRTGIGGDSGLLGGEGMVAGSVFAGGGVRLLQ